jgi:hypothetical protein
MEMTPQSRLYKAAAEPVYSLFKIVRMHNHDYTAVDVLNYVPENVNGPVFRQKKNAVHQEDSYHHANAVYFFKTC